MYISKAKAIGDERSREKEKNARQILKVELGHSPGRDDVVSQYVGSYK
jgi:hypothetical protein